MPVTYRFDSNIVIVEMAGEYHPDEIRTALLDALADSACPMNAVLLIDLMGAQSINKRSTEEIKSIAYFIAGFGERFNKRIAIAAPGDLPYGLMRMSASEAGEWGIDAEVCRTFADAWTWLKR